MILRKYEPSDCEAMAKLFYDTVHTINAKDYTKEQLNAWATGKVDSEAWNQSFLDHVTLVAVEENQIVGFGDIDQTGYLDRLYVHKDYQNQGIATALCDKLEPAFPAENLTTHASITAKPFFEARGYQVVKEQQVIRNGVVLTNYIMKKNKVKTLTQQLKNILLENGAALVGCADLSKVTEKSLKYGVSVAVPVQAQVVKEILDGPTKEYFDAYHEIENKLNQIVLAGERFLIEQGYHAFAQTSQRIQEDSNWRTEMPHKTVATHAGIGWIGKSCLLVTKEFGSAIRISSILTDAPLVFDTPNLESKCGGCRKCVEACPAQALSGITWKIGVDRDEMLNKEACVEKQIELTKKKTGIESEFLCGRCFAVCPHTQRYLNQL